MPYSFLLQRRGLTIVELLVVLVIIAGLLGLLLPAVQSAREASRATSCKNNLHQLWLAMRMYQDDQKHLPSPAPRGRAGGWTVEILWYLEQEPLYRRMREVEFDLDLVIELPAVQERLGSLACPSVADDDAGSTIPNVPRSDYMLVLYKDIPEARKGDLPPWQIVDAPVDLDSPWIIGPEMLWSEFERRDHEGPHSRGRFHRAYEDGSIRRH
jgi:prepilin-type N-terminal cleavage/methylation domain-containing protein